MPEFDLDDLKKTWQQQHVAPKYNSHDIEAMLNKSSRNYVKYILGISIIEFLVMLCMNIYYTFLGDDSKSFMTVLGKLGVHSTDELQASFSHLYFILKIISLLMTAFFVVRFYRNFRRIKIEANLKRLILQIMRFKKTVNLFILANILLLIIFTVVLTFFTFSVLSSQHVEMSHPTLIGFVIGLVLMTGLSVVLIWVYYRIVYGILLKRLGKNLAALQKIEAEHP
ncbi:beta-carotene 15,15'-monooxygenase [Chryseobacterium sp. 6424]|uniref:beta-carotene 15,15'-monooxygenase n=1 Tax=Chryseobacterium sp. 6424 TaxID=2039166 RepID=UPI000EFAF261|nr:beta-carotene 15,15'-monooxygenase [Chryseobacterium sp. 6424]AYO57132.1 beta-carotene 15,15'-monooxygenase [Chryseobacterium sp. 6424]